MLRPRMQIVTTATKDYKFSEDLDKSFSNVVFQSFRQHEFAMGRNGKLLVVVRGSSDMVPGNSQARNSISRRRSGMG